MSQIDPSGETQLSTLSEPSRPAPTPERIGRHYAHFRVEQALGRGGMGEVYLASDQSLDRKVALKFLPREVAADEKLRERFLREARAQARISHPNVCHIYYVGEQDRELFFAMEYVDGETLQARLDRVGKLPGAEALELCRQAALGLREAHRHGFTHRDVKPSNLMVDRHGVVKLLDFGIVKEVADPAADGRAPLTFPGGTTLVGTPHYMAPEQAKGERIDFRADIYALGATLHHLVTGKPPFEGASAMAVVSMHLTEARPAIRAGRIRGVSPIDDLCDRMMAKGPPARFASYDDLLDALALVFRQPAGIWVRMQAQIADWVLIGVVAAGLILGSTALLELDPTSTDHAGDVVVHLLAFAYFTTCHARWGKTAGKAAVGIELLRTDRAGPVGGPRAIVRHLGQWAPMYVITVTSWALAPVSAVAGEWVGILGFLVVLPPIVLAWLRPDRRALWDLRTSTVVRRKAPKPYRPEA